MATNGFIKCQTSLSLHSFIKLTFTHPTDLLQLVNLINTCSTYSSASHMIAFHISTLYGFPPLPLSLHPSLRAKKINKYMVKHWTKLAKI